ncbi:MAG: RNA 2',3'-cyclic phosphodiesterase [Syntrophobacter sp.]
MMTVEHRAENDRVMEPGSIRGFIAVDLPAAVRRSLEALALELKKSDAPVSWTRTEGIHLTLKFLGNVAPATIDQIKPVLAEIASGATVFRIQAAGCGAFPNIKQPRVIWAGMRGESEPLTRLQKEVDLAMVRFGFEPEDRPFRPHLTLGRVKGRQRLHALQQILLTHQEFTAEPFDVTELVLYKSELRPDGARYTPLFRAPFSGRPRLSG